MNFNGKTEMRKIAEQIGGIPTKLPISYLLIDLEYYAWHQINA